MRCSRCLLDIREVAPVQRVEAATVPRRGPAGRARLALPRARWLIPLLAGVVAVAAVLAVVEPWEGEPPPVLAQSAVSAPATAGEVWSGPGGGTSGARVSAAVLSPGARVAWSFEAPAGIVALAADAHRVYVSTHDARLVALDVASGEEAWTVDVPGQIDQPPAIVGGLLYVALRPSEVAALDAATGETVWSRGVPDLGYVWASPVVADGLVWVAGQRGLQVLDAQTGAPLREQAHERVVTAPPVVAGEYLTLATSAEQYTYSRANAARTFHYPLHGIRYVAASGDATVVLSDTTIASTLAGASPHWWEGRTLRRLWTNVWLWGVAPEIPPPVHEWNARLPAAPYRPAVDAEAAFVTDQRGGIRRYELATGAVAWERADAGATGPPIVTPAGVLLPSQGALALLDPATGAERERWPLPATPFDVVLTTAGAFVVVGDGSTPSRVIALR